MSPRDSTDRAGSARRAKPDVYTTMLGLAVAATLVAIVLLILEWGAYDFDTSPTGMRDAGRYDAAVQTALAAAMPQAVLRPSTNRQPRSRAACGGARRHKTDHVNV